MKSCKYVNSSIRGELASWNPICIQVPIIYIIGCVLLSCENKY